MPLLNTIVMSNNDIKELQPEAFSELQDLRQIDLHNNSIDYIHPSLFQNNPKLSMLDLSCNNIKCFQLDFNVNTELKVLNLSSNMLKFEVLPLFLPVTSLQILDLSNNQIEILSGEVFEGMVVLKHLNISGNPELEYDCHLRTLWTLCSEQKIRCITDDEQSFRMVDNLFCETAEHPKALSLTEETDELTNTNESTTEGREHEGSGTDSVGSMWENETREPNSTEKVFIEPTITTSNIWMVITISVSSWFCVILIIVAVIYIFKRRRSHEETSGNLSRTSSFDYLNQEDQFNRRYKNSRSDNNKIRNQHDCVKLPESNRNVFQFQVGDSVAAQIVRVPSFKNRCVATPLNLPEEISLQETELAVHNKTAMLHQSPINLRSRLNPATLYEQNETVRAGSIKHKKHPEMSASDS
jgi:hypothetical protein